MRSCQAPYLSSGTFVEMVDEDMGIIEGSVGSGSQSLVKVLSIIDREDLKSGAKVALKPGSSAVVRVLPADHEPGVQMLSASEKPDVTYQDIGGLDV